MMCSGNIPVSAPMAHQQSAQRHAQISSNGLCANNSFVISQAFSFFTYFTYCFYLFYQSWDYDVHYT